MRNHAEKQRDMARSVLPSTARKSARANKANYNRRHRRYVRDVLHDWKSYEHADDFERPVWGPFNNPMVGWDNMGEVVQMRRNHDKLTVCHWAQRLCATLPELIEADLDDRIAFFRKVMPDNLIGRHAVGHIRYSVDPENPYRHYKEQEAARKLDRAKLVAKVVEACEVIVEARGAHKALNLALKSSHISAHHRTRWDSTLKRIVPGASYTCDACPEARVLYGVHDIEDFADDIVGWEHQHPRTDLVLGIAGRLKARRVA